MSQLSGVQKPAPVTVLSNDIVIISEVSSFNSGAQKTVKEFCTEGGTRHGGAKLGNYEAFTTQNSWLTVDSWQRTF